MGRLAIQWFEYRRASDAEMIAASNAERASIEADGYVFTYSEWRGGLSGRRLAVQYTSVERARPQPLGSNLAGATANWTLPVLVRVYDNDDTGRGLMAIEAQELGTHGYEPAAQSEDGGHIHAGRLILTGGLSVFAGKAGIRSDGRMTVTFKKAAPPPAPWAAPAQPTLTSRLEQLEEARSAGLLTENEYQGKRQQILDGH